MSGDHDQPYEGAEFVDLISQLREKAFVGQYPFDTIVTSLRDQFANYISTEDRTDYVGVFYDQLDRSVEVATTANQGYQTEITLECLVSIRDEFTTVLVEMVEDSLGIGIEGYYDGLVNPNELREIFLAVYRYFILDAKNNFRVAIATDFELQWESFVGSDETDYISAVQRGLSVYDPRLSTITPDDFFRHTGATEVSGLYADHRIVGNFLLRYSPKLYRNEIFTVELTSYIIAHHELRINFGKALTAEQGSSGE